MLLELQELIKALSTQKELEKTILERAFNCITRMLKMPEAAAQCATHKHTVFKSILFMNKTYAGELQMNALRVFHPLCRVPDFKKICLEDH